MAGNKVLSPNKVFFPNLDGFRFWAFLLVFIGHAFREAIDQTDWSGFGYKLIRDSVFNSGDMGVSFFFVLSGFLISYLILNEIELKGRLNVAAFYMRRILRIWPLYYFVIFFSFVIYPIISTGAFQSLRGMGNPFYFVFFLSNFEMIYLVKQGQGNLLSGITWSVAIEEQFYAVWPLLFLLTPRRCFKYVFWLVILFSLIFRAFNRNDGNILYLHSISVISDMAVGGLAAYLAIKSKRFVQFFASLPRVAGVGIYLIGLLLFVGRNYVYSSEILSPDASWIYLQVFSMLVIFRRLVLAVFFAFVLMDQNYGENSFFKMCRFHRVSELGKYTYGLYLLHPIALWILHAIPSSGQGIWVDGLITFTAGLPLSILLAYGSYRYFETPFLHLKEKFSYTHTKLTSIDSQNWAGKTS